MEGPSQAPETNDAKPPFISPGPPSRITFEPTLPWYAGEDQEYEWRKPELDVRVNRYINKSLPELKKMFGDDGSTIGLMIVYSFEAVVRLKRFVDQRQTKLTEIPNHDGSNLLTVNSEQQADGQQAGDEGLFYRSSFGQPSGRRQPWGSQREGFQETPFVRRVYDFYVRWLTFLHYDSLVKLDPTCSSKRQALKTMDRTRLDEFYNDLIFAPDELLAAEKHEQLGKDGNPNVPKPEPGFEWIWELERILQDALASIIAARRWSAQRHENLRDGESQAWDSIQPMGRLIILLLAKEYEFDYSITCEHVEDVSYDKRVVIISPKEALTCGRSAMIDLTNNLGTPLREAIAKTQRKLRDIHDFRLLRDWGYGRPWKKLFVLLDTVADKNNTDKLGYRSLSDCIKELLAHINSSRKAYDLFDFHPIDMKEHDKEESCTICMSEFEPNGCIMQLWCSHWFHPTCILEYWDVENRYIYACPNCRHSPPTLRDRVKFDAEKDDVDVTDYDRTSLDGIMEADIRRARRSGLAPRRLPRSYRIYLLQRELSRINAQRREKEKKEEERGFPPTS